MFHKISSFHAVVVHHRVHRHHPHMYNSGGTTLCSRPNHYITITPNRPRPSPWILVHSSLLPPPREVLLPGFRRGSRILATRPLSQFFLLQTERRGIFGVTVIIRLKGHS